VVQFVVLKDNGDTLFRSGTFSSSYEVNYLSGPYEEHHDIINQQAQSQIYEMVMGDVIGNKTTVLERAAIVLKDNRLVPNGFTTSHFAYDTAKIDNIALADDDFNKTTAGAEGTGKDIVHFHIPTNGYSGLINVYAKIYYQSVPPGWLQEMFSYSTAFIDTFRNMYQAADKTPVLCASDELLNVQLLNGIDENNSSGKVSVYPSLAFDGLINIRAEKVSAFEIYSSDGKLMKRESGLNTDFISNIKLPYESGIYFVKVFSLTGIHIYKIYLN
jgi:hypothetical protein